MNKRFMTLMLMRRVFAATGEGKGLATALVQVFSGTEGREKEVARRLLLGFPARVALEPIINDDSRELGMLAALMADSASSSARKVGRKGETLSLVMERWLKARDARAMEQKVMQTRSFIMSAVLGAVVSMLASLGPLVSNLNFFSSAPPANAEALFYTAGAMVVISSGLLGLFMSGRRFYVNPLISLATFALVAVAVAPIASVPAVSLWGIK